MNKMLAVIKREYLQAVRKKMFIFMTLFFPVLMAALFIVPGLMVARGLGGKKVAVSTGPASCAARFRTRSSLPSPIRRRHSPAATADNCPSRSTSSMKTRTGYPISPRPRSPISTASTSTRRRTTDSTPSW